MSKNLLIAVLAGAAALTTSAASAATFVIDTTTNAPLPGVTYTDFNNRTLGSTTQTTGTGITVSFTGGGQFVQGSSGALYQAPIVTNGNGTLFAGQANGPDATTYASSGIGSATLTFVAPLSYIGLLWGSIDGYNSITFRTADGLTQTYGALSVFATADGTMSRYVNFFSSSPILSVTMSSTSDSFEFDNVATGAPLPEASTWAMMLAGFGAVGYAMRRRQKVANKVAYAA